MKKFFMIGLVVLVVLSFVTCATIITGSDQKISITSQPSGANVKIFDANNLPVWDSTTPSVVTLKKGHGFFEAASYRVEITKEGYEKQQVFISGEINVGWYLVGNIFIGGLIGWLIVDPLTGAMWTLSPDMVYAPLGQQSALPERDGDLVVILKQDIPTELYETLDLVRVH